MASLWCRDVRHPIVMCVCFVGICGAGSPGRGVLIVFLILLGVVPAEKDARLLILSNLPNSQ